MLQRGLLQLYSLNKNAKTEPKVYALGSKNQSLLEAETLELELTTEDGNDPTKPRSSS